MPLLRGPYNARPPAGAAPHSGGRRRKRAGLELLLRNPLFFLIFAVRVSQKFCRATLRVQRQVSRINGKVVEAPLKTKNSYRSISLGADAVEILKEQRKKCGSSPYVFPSPTGGPISPDSVIQMLHRVLKRAGLPKVRFHDLRHTFATVALQNGVDIKTVSGMLGHYSAGFTLDTYAHVTTQAQREAAKTMGSVLSSAL